MRISTFIILLYAFLSLFTPRFPGIQFFETTGLLLFQPWDFLCEAVGLDGLPDPSAGPSRTADSPPVESSSPVAPSWWDKVFHIDDPSQAFTLLGARKIDAPSSSRKETLYYGNPESRVTPGSPVIAGGALIGFVNEMEHPSIIPVVMLNSPASRLVLGELRGTVAGSEVVFVAGGPSTQNAEGIRVQIPSSRFGLTRGSPAYTRENSRTPGVPSGLLLGHVDVDPPRLGQIRGDISLVPPFSEPELNRVAVLIPNMNPRPAHAVKVPPVPLEFVSLKARLVPAGRSRPPCFRIYGGVEKGLRKGDLLVMDGVAVGRLDRRGLLISSASCLLRAGQKTHAAICVEGDSACQGFMDVLRQEGFSFQVRWESCIQGLKVGCPVYLSESPCSGLEEYPAFFVKDPGDGEMFWINIPRPGQEKRSGCLRSLIYR